MSVRASSSCFLLCAALAGAPACTGTIEADVGADAASAGPDSRADDAIGPAPADPDAAPGQSDAAPQSDDGVPSGAILFQERFDDADFEARDWYDGPAGSIAASEHAPGSASAFECTFEAGSQGCRGGTPSRHKFAPTSRIYLSFYVKHSSNWVGSQRPYHPHLLHFVTDADDDYVGPAYSHLTTYIESPNGTPFLGLQDSRNVDSTCILRNDDSFVGCGGDFESYSFGENRSVCACNGLVGDLDGRDCFDAGDYWYSSRSWRADDVYFRDEPGAYDKTSWHFIEAYFEMNSVSGGVGIADGKIRYLYDGEVLISSDHVLLRTSANATMQFNQFLIAPYIGDGSPVTQTIWLDDITVATGRP